MTGTACTVLLFPTIRITCHGAKMPLPTMPTKPADKIKPQENTISENSQPEPTKTKTTARPSKTRRPATQKKKLTGTNRQTPLSKAASLSGIPKIFVLDTNVLMHDPTSLFKFEEHDIFVPMKILEELDAHKRGLADTARNARQVSRVLDRLIADVDSNVLLSQGIPLDKLGNIEAKGKLYLEAATDKQIATDNDQNPDNQILSAVLELSKAQGNRMVVLVSKDINIRLKARALGLSAEDYFNDQVLDDQDLLYPGLLKLPDDFWDTHSANLKTHAENDHMATARQSIPSKDRQSPHFRSTNLSIWNRMRHSHLSKPVSQPSTVEPLPSRRCTTIQPEKTMSGASMQGTLNRTLP